DPAGLEGLAKLTGELMRTGGTRNITADTVNETLDFMAASVEVSTGMESTSVDLSVFTQDREKGIDIFAQILKEPAFSQDRIDIAKGLEVETLKRIRDDYTQLAFREFSKCFYRGDPRGRTASVSSIRQIGREDLLGFHRRYFQPANIMMAVTGDISTAEALSLIGRHFDSWTGAGKQSESLPIPKGRPGGIHYLFKQVPQSVIIVGYLAPGRGDSDYYPFAVLDFIIGSGGFRSLLTQKIRSDQGLAYRVGSYYRNRSGHGVFAAYAMTKSSTTTRVLSLIQDIIGTGPLQAEDEERLSWAKRSLDNSFIFSFQSARQIAVQALMAEFEGLPGDYLTRYRERIEQVQGGDLKRVARKYLSGEAVTLILGDQNAFDQPLERFGPVNTLPEDTDR
ncbi:MAG: insulinase family protein, partial [Syntrophales bacterium LBB04]|nr:insulinase family protein [Syntrophales bacterium LBB04]